MQTGTSNNIREAQKDFGLGQPPEYYGDPDVALAAECSPQGRIEIVEDARWRVDLPIADADLKTFANRIDVWGTDDGKPPPGVTTATNTLTKAGLPNSDMVLIGLSVRILVEPEARTIDGNMLNADISGPSNSLPGSPDVWTQNDVTNNALGLTEGQVLTPAELAWGLATWRCAYAFVNAYELAWIKNHQDRLLQEPLTAIAHIEPFAQAEAAGLAFASNLDRINLLNQRLVQIAFGGQFLPITHKRVGSVGDNTMGNPNVGIFEPTREQDAAATMFGGIGVTQNLLQKDPYVFSTPIFWPLGQPVGIQFIPNDPAYQAEFLRWLSVTGQTSAGGPAGADQDLPLSQVTGLNGLSPATTGALVMLEQTLDPSPALVSQQVQTNRAIEKGGAMVFEIGLIGKRVTPAWAPVVYKAIKAGAISAPMGTGTLAAA